MSDKTASRTLTRDGMPEEPLMVVFLREVLLQDRDARLSAEGVRQVVEYIDALRQWALRRPAPRDARWVSCSEQMPAEWAEIIGWFPKQRSPICIGKWLRHHDGGMVFWCNGTSGHESNFPSFAFTHWMPLPAAPNEEPEMSDKPASETPRTDAAQFDVVIDGKYDTDARISKEVVEANFARTLERALQSTEQRAERLEGELAGAKRLLENTEFQLRMAQVNSDQERAARERAEADSERLDWLASHPDADVRIAGYGSPRYHGKSLREVIDQALAQKGTAL